MKRCFFLIFLVTCAHLDLKAALQKSDGQIHITKNHLTRVATQRGLSLALENKTSPLQRNIVKTITLATKNLFTALIYGADAHEVTRLLLCGADPEALLVVENQTLVFSLTPHDLLALPHFNQDFHEICQAFETADKRITKGILQQRLPRSKKAARAVIKILRSCTEQSHTKEYVAQQDAIHKKEITPEELQILGFCKKLLEK